MKNFLLLFLLSFVSFSSVSAQCFIETSSLPTIIPAGTVLNVSAEIVAQDVINGGTMPQQSSGAWTIVCTNCTINTIVGGANMNAGAVVSITAGDTTGGMTVSFSAPTAACSNAVSTGAAISSVLPVELSSFFGSAVKDAVELNWSTSLELNNDFFTVERSFDGKEFAAVSKIAGAGDSEEEVNYTFSDEDVTRVATANTAYYRLKQTDFDGAFTYSDVISVNLENRADLEVTNVTIAGNDLAVNFVSPREGATEISVYDLTGRLIATTNQVATEGYNTTNLALNTKQSGVFIVRITNGQTQTVRKIVK